MHIRMGVKMIFVHKSLTTDKAYKFEILLVFVNVQVKVVNACKFLLAVWLGTQYLGCNVFILKLNDIISHRTISLFLCVKSII